MYKSRSHNNQCTQDGPIIVHMTTMATTPMKHQLPHCGVLGFNTMCIMLQNIYICTEFKHNNHYSKF